jgi:hypothetical protein
LEYETEYIEGLGDGRRKKSEYMVMRIVQGQLAILLVGWVMAHATFVTAI